MEFMRIATVGSVDDGKSTLIGRLLYDTKQVFSDQLEAIERASAQRGADYVDLSLLTDGLRAEREQGITIDVAHRYFATPRRKFVVADTPGHIQYTRNMVTGASTADLVLILIDARHGITEQTRRHAFLASLLSVPRLVVCVNKMDLVGWSEDRYREIVSDFRDFSDALAIRDIRFVPMSALLGDNVVERSPMMSWYGEQPLLPLLEETRVDDDHHRVGARFPVQYVIRPHRTGYEDYRGYAGTVVAGTLAVGDEVVVLPSGSTTTITAIDTAQGPVESAFPPMSAVLRLGDDVDISRGDMVCRPEDRPSSGQDLEAMVAWLSEETPLVPGRRYVVRHTTTQVKAVVRDLRYRVDINTTREDGSATRLDLNEIGRVSMRTSQPLFHDPYRANRTTGSFILIDESTFATVGGGMIIGAGA